MNIIRKIFSLYLFKLSNKNKKIYIPKIINISNSTFLEGSNYIGKGSSIVNSEVGYGSYIGGRSCLNNTKIGRFTSIADNVNILISDHPTSLVSTHPAFYNGEHDLIKKLGLSFNTLRMNISDENNKKTHRVIIGSDVWIGQNVFIKDNISIGNGAIIAAGAIVTKNVPDYAIVGGIPATIIRYRFSIDLVEKLRKTEWWLLDIEQIKKIKNKFLKPEEFIKYFEGL